MHCSHCGHLVVPSSRFCPNCGSAIVQATYQQHVIRPALLRPRTGRMVAGVCAAFARTYGWNVTLVRILLVVLTPFHLGIGFLAYVVAWVVIPEEPYVVSAVVPGPPPTQV